jgi:hypothetical protein
MISSAASKHVGKRGDSGTAKRTKMADQGSYRNCRGAMIEGCGIRLNVGLSRDKAVLDGYAADVEKNGE